MKERSIGVTTKNKDIEIVVELSIYSQINKQVGIIINGITLSINTSDCQILIFKILFPKQALSEVTLNYPLILTSFIKNK